jgi:hypothetical protein
MWLLPSPARARRACPLPGQGEGSGNGEGGRKEGLKRERASYANVKLYDPHRLKPVPLKRAGEKFGNKARFYAGC